MTVIKYKDNYIEQMNEFFVGVAVDDGKEAVIAMVVQNNGLPFINSMVGASEKDRDAILEKLPEVSKETGKPTRLIRFTRVDVIEEFS